MKLDDVLSEHIEYKLDRMPMLVDPSTGQPTAEFKTFVDKICKCVTENRLDCLYELSDQCLTEENFIESIVEMFGKSWKTYLSANPKRRGIDIQFNRDRLEGAHRCLVGGLYVLTYVINLNKSDMRSFTSGAIKLYRTELLFGYKDNQFKILSSFTPFVEVKE